MKLMLLLGSDRKEMMRSMKIYASFPRHLDFLIRNKHLALFRNTSHWAVKSKTKVIYA